MNKSPVDPTLSVAQRIDARIQSLPGWQKKLLTELRRVILAADGSVVEEWKWNVPVWSSKGLICTAETYKQTVKLTFAHGASLPDPARLFNSSLDGKVRRAIDFREDDEVNRAALSELIRAAVARNHRE
jgi:hypothetical protein